MSALLDSLTVLVGEKRVQIDEPLETHTVLKVPLIAEMYLEIDTLDLLIRVVRLARDSNTPVYILGGGSRLLSKGKIKGIVIKNTCRKFHKIGLPGALKNRSTSTDQVYIYAESGVNVNQLIRYTLDEGLEGLEYQLGLPGSVGGAIYTSAKYKPKYLLFTTQLHSLSILAKDGTVQTFTTNLPHFVYTDEVWEPTDDIILSAVFRLAPQDKKMLWEKGEEAVAWREKEKLKNE